MAPSIPHQTDRQTLIPKNILMIQTFSDGAGIIWMVIIEASIIHDKRRYVYKKLNNIEKLNKNVIA